MLKEKCLLFEEKVKLKKKWNQQQQQIFKGIYYQSLNAIKHLRFYLVDNNKKILPPTRKKSRISL